MESGTLKKSVNFPIDCATVTIKIPKNIIIFNPNEGSNPKRKSLLTKKQLAVSKIIGKTISRFIKDAQR